MYVHTTNKIVFHSSVYCSSHNKTRLVSVFHPVCYTNWNVYGLRSKR